MNPAADSLTGVALELDRWMRAQAWPLWWSRGRHPNGAFYEALDFSGQPVRQNVSRVRVQARQIYSFALAASQGWPEPNRNDRLARSLDRFMNTCLGPTGLPGMLIDIESGQMTDPQPNLYVSAFTVLALAQCRIVLDDSAIDERIAQFLEAIERGLAYADGAGYRETLPPDAFRYQNPHMHFYESLLVLYDNARDPDIATRAARLLEFIRQTFFDESSGTVMERVPVDGPARPRTYEPGHSLEWVWLLACRSRLFGIPLDPFAVTLYETYVSAGIPEGQTPMLMTIEQHPEDASCRLWSQTEALKAHLAIAELGPNRLRPGALSRARSCAESIRDHWLATPCPGGFYDHFDPDGRLIAEDIPGSMGYHLYVAIRESTRVLDALA